MAGDRFYTGVGSRKTPEDVLDLMREIGYLMWADLGLVLRSGGANGADSAFEEGCDDAGGKKEIYLPWEGFNGHTSPLYGVNEAALTLASAVHPAWHNCSYPARKLHARNCYQVLGGDLKTPSSVLICWMKGAGGTRTAFQLAARSSIGIVNLAVGHRDTSYGVVTAVKAMLNGGEI